MALNLHSEDYSMRNSETNWLNQFRGELPLLEISTDSIRQFNETRGMEILSKIIDKQLTDEFRSLLQACNTKLLPGLLTVINILLFKYTSQEDIILGSRIDHPESSASEKKIKDIILRCQFNESDNFITLHKKIAHQLSEAYEHGHYSLENLIDNLNIKTLKDRNPLFDAMVLLDNLANDTSSLNNLYLLFEFNSKGTSLELKINYANDLFYEDTISRLSNHFEALLRSVIEDPHKPIYALSYLSSIETNALIKNFNGPEVSFPESKTMVDLFEEQVLASPSNIALTFEDTHISYLELNSRSNQLAAYLKKNGVCKDFLVPMCIDRSVEMIVGILGILKAGGAYVPIDPDLPSNRIDFLLRDTSATVVLSSSTYSIKLDKAENIEVIKLDADWNLIGKEDAGNVKSDIDPNDLAYVIYTSGSTGTPKGVLIEHRNVVRLFKNDKALFDFTANDVWTMFHSYTFDFSVWEMYGAFFYGGRLVVVPKHVTKDLSIYAELLVKENVTVLNQTPSAFYVLQDFLMEHSNITPMRYIIFGGEALNPSKLQPWKTLYPQTKLVNMYGITETTVHVSYQEIEKQHIVSGKSIIGQPIPTLNIYILDKYQNLLPVGVPGEICIGGAGLARGYLNRPELTLEKFISNPLKDASYTRLYKSGDLGKRLPDGNIEYLGRIDNQVKIRGYRIELGEIENLLQQYSKIEAAVVLVKGVTSAEKQLIAFLVSKSELDLSELKVYLNTKLPEYMIPSMFVQSKEIPLTPNGKIDSKALLASIANSELFKSPDSYINTDAKNLFYDKVRKIILDISGTDINVTDINSSFVKLGLNSLLLTQITHMFKKEFGSSVSFKQLNDSISSPALLLDYLNTNAVTPKENITSIPGKLNNEPVSVERNVSNPAKSRTMDTNKPPVPGARLGRDQKGNPAWFIINPEQPGKYIQLSDS